MYYSGYSPGIKKNLLINMRISLQLLFAFYFIINSIKVKWAGHVGSRIKKEIQNFGIKSEKRKPFGYQGADRRRIRIWTFQ